MLRPQAVTLNPIAFPALRYMCIAEGINTRSAVEGSNNGHKVGIPSCRVGLYELVVRC